MHRVQFHNRKRAWKETPRISGNSFRLEERLNNALRQAGIYNMRVVIFGVEDAIDVLGWVLPLSSWTFKLPVIVFRQVYHVPNIFLQHVNGTWLDGPLELSRELHEILISNQLQRLATRLYRLSKAYSLFYAHPLSSNDRDYLRKLVLTLYNQQSKTKRRDELSHPMSIPFQIP